MHCFVTNVVKNKNSSASGIVHDDRRGLSSPSNKITDADMELVRNHILALPAYESHYCRKDTDKKYLPHYYTISQIYEEYKWLLPEKTPVCRIVYQKMFHSLGIKIKSPKKDTCATCNKFDLLMKTCSDDLKKSEIREKLLSHQADAEKAYEVKRIDKQESLNDDTKMVYTFDLQQCLPTPDVKTSVAFYKRQLLTFNLTLHRCDDQQAFCFMWHEALAARGANQIASCIYKLFQKISPAIKELTFYSDTCPGQNKNSFLSIMFMILIKQHPHIEYINHKFLVPGHTHMECDTDHCIIEKKKKKYAVSIDHPRDWMNLVRLCGNKKPFKFEEMNISDFLEFSALFKTI